MFITVSVNPNRDIVTTDEGTEQSAIKVSLWNEGKTPAILTKLNIAAFLSENKPPEIEDIIRTEIPAGGVIIRSGGKYDSITGVRISKKQWGEIQVSISYKLFCWGSVEYKDIFGARHKTGFCWEYSPFRSSFYLSNNEELNYYT